MFTLTKCNNLKPVAAKEEQQDEQRASLLTSPSIIDVLAFENDIKMI
jgi:hypothetical protein